jgi:peptidoglycan/LPS O-acetylase OafA/YrhL
VISDTVLGLSFALHLVAAKQFDGTLASALQRLAPAIRWGAARSFTLYLMHQPVLFLLTALMLQVADGPWRPAVILAGTVALPMLMAPLIEAQRHRLRPWVERLQNHLWPRADAITPQTARG